MDKASNKSQKEFSKDMSYDVVIVNYFGEKVIRPCLDSLLASSVKPAKIIIYDNNSQDESINIIEKYYPQVLLIKGEKNIGFARSNNEGMRHSTSDFILFVNNDVIVDKYCAERLLDNLEDNRIALANPLIYRGWEKRSDAEIYSFGAEVNMSGFAYSLFDTEPNRTDLSCFSGACFMARSEVVKRIQYEGHFFMYYEEPVMSIKTLMEGHLISRTNEAKCYHLESYSSPKKKSDGVCFRQYHAIQNRWYMLGSYWPTTALLAAMPLNIIHLIYNVLFFIRSGKFRETKLIYLAFSNLVEGRRLYPKKQNNTWMGKLAGIKLPLVINLKKRVYS